jgi:predicted Zn-dependent protease
MVAFNSFSRPATILLALLLGVPAAFAQQPTRADAEKDPVLKAMLVELDRSKNQLHLEGFEKPFFIEYRMDDLEGYATRGEFGATLGSSSFQRRAIRVTVRVGDYKTDSSGRGEGIVSLETIDDDAIALRSAIWMATDQAYKNALDAYARKQAELKQVQTPPQADDLSQEKPAVVLEAPQRLKLDGQGWQQWIAKASGLFRSEPSLAKARPDVQYSVAYFDAQAVSHRLVNSEGSIARTSDTYYDIAYSTGGQAADGMSLDRSYYLAGKSLADLGTEADFDRHAIECVNGLEELRAAPIVEEEYHGPVLLSADASAGILKNLLAGGVVANRPALGTQARTTGAFASSFHARVLPDFFSVTDNPALGSYEGRTLVGAYSIDQEGVPAQSVELVKSGKLENYLIGRQPIRDFPHSNGHGRAGLFGAPQPALGVLKIESSEGFSTAELNQKLLDMAKDRGLGAVYAVEAMAGRMAPRLLYKVSSSGQRTLVRGARLEDLDLRALRSGIVAAGKELFVNNQLGSIPDTVLAPALLFDEITVRRANEKNDKLPFYPPPA